MDVGLLDHKTTGVVCYHLKGDVYMHGSVKQEMFISKLSIQRWSHDFGINGTGIYHVMKKDLIQIKTICTLYIETPM